VGFRNVGVGERFTSAIPWVAKIYFLELIVAADGFSAGVGLANEAIRPAPQKRQAICCLGFKRNGPERGGCLRNGGG